MGGRKQCGFFAIITKISLILRMDNGRRTIPRPACRVYFAGPGKDSAVFAQHRQHARMRIN
jgi:hypothetical protein